MTPRILAICPDPMDGTSFYRGLGPLSALHRARQIELTQAPNHVDWMLMQRFDIVFMQRPWGPDMWKVAEIVLDAGLPLWIDYDDAQYAVPPHNPAYFTYQGLNWMNKFVGAATAISVTTKQLKKDIGGEVSIIPNGLDDRWVPLKREHTPNKKISWRGSNIHEEDWFCRINNLKNILLDRSLEKNFFGFMPACVVGTKPENIIFHPHMSVNKYMRTLCELNPAVHLVPLVNSVFNKAKSNIAWMEATLAGARVLADQISTEWHVPGCGNLADFSSGDNKVAWEFIQDTLLLSKTNELRMELITELMGG